MQDGGGALMSLPISWQKEPGWRVAGTRDLDRWKVQAPCIMRSGDGRWRLFYTGVGPGKPFADCQGYVLSAVSDDGLHFVPEPGIRVAPQPDLPQMALRVLAPSIAARPQGGWRMYFEARGSADVPTAICSAVSDDQINWTVEQGARLTAPGGMSGPRFVPLADAAGRLYCVQSHYDARGPGHGPRIRQTLVSALTEDGLTFVMEPGVLLPATDSALENAGITAAVVLAGAPWRMVYSAWQDVPPGTQVPLHPSADPTAQTGGGSANFAAASIAADMAGYRSRILSARSDDGLMWDREGVIIEGDGYGGRDIDAVHAEDMSLIPLGDGRWRMYYAACDAQGVWRVASAIGA